MICPKCKGWGNQWGEMHGRLFRILEMSNEGRDYDEQILQKIRDKFASGNSVPVSTVNISAEEWEQVEKIIDDLLEYKWIYEDLSK